MTTQLYTYADPIRRNILTASVVDPQHFDAEPNAEADPTFHPDADPDPDSSFQIKDQTLKKCSNRLISINFGLSFAN
jgi:hypothetical protein